MAVSSVSSAANDLASQSSSSTANGASDRFLKLLVAQMQNQDPLNPMDNAQVTSQMAQIQTVTGIEKLNTTVAGPDGQAYKARQVVFQTELMGRAGALPGADGTAGVRVSTVREDQTPGRRVHDPKHPAADAEGYVTYSNVNPVEEMVNMISASRSYQNNIEVMNTAKSLLLKTLQMGQ